MVCVEKVFLLVVVDMLVLALVEAGRHAEPSCVLFGCVQVF